MNIIVGIVGKVMFLCSVCQTTHSGSKAKHVTASESKGSFAEGHSDSAEVLSKRMEEDKDILAQVIQYLLEEEIIKQRMELDE